MSWFLFIKECCFEMCSEVREQRPKESSHRHQIKSTPSPKYFPLGPQGPLALCPPSVLREAPAWLPGGMCEYGLVLVRALIKVIRVPGPTVPRPPQWPGRHLTVKETKHTPTTILQLSFSQLTFPYKIRPTHLVRKAPTSQSGTASASPLLTSIELPVAQNPLGRVPHCL